MPDLSSLPPGGAGSLPHLISNFRQDKPFEDLQAGS